MISRLSFVALALLSQLNADKPCCTDNFDASYQFTNEQQSLSATKYISRILKTVTDLAYFYQCALNGKKEREAHQIGDDILTNLCKAKQFVSCDHTEKYLRELSCGNVYNCYQILKKEVHNYDYHPWRGYVDISYKSKDIGSCNVGPYRNTAELQKPFIGGIYLIGSFSSSIKFYEWNLASKSRIALYEPLFLMEEMLSFSSWIDISSRLDYEFFVYIIGYYRRLLQRRDKTYGSLDRFKKLYLKRLYDTGAISLLRLKIVNLLMVSCVLANEKFSYVETILKHMLSGKNVDLEVYFQIICRCYGENKVLHSIGGS